MSDSQMREVAGAVLPLGLLPAAAALVSDYAAVGSRVVADDLAARFGRPVTGRDVGRMWRQRPVRDPAEVALQSGGPLLCRELRLFDQAPPYRPLAYCQEMIVPGRLPAAVLADLESSGEPADRLFTQHGVAWSAELLGEESYVASLAEAMVDLSWLEPDAVLVELVRRVLVDGLPVALLLDQLPLLAARGPLRAPA